MRKVVLTLLTVLVLAAFTFAGCETTETKKTTGTKSTTTKSTATTTTKKAPTQPATK